MHCSFSCCFVLSTAGYEVGDWEGMNFYTATKHAVTALTEGLRVELRKIKSNIKITVRERVYLFISCIIDNYVHICRQYHLVKLLQSSDHDLNNKKTLRVPLNLHTASLIMK